MIESNSCPRGDALLGISKEQGNSRTLGNIGEIAVNLPKGIREHASQKVQRQTAQLKCHYTSAYRWDLGTMLKLENSDLFAITGTLWNELHDRSTAI